MAEHPIPDRVDHFLVGRLNRLYRWPESLYLGKALKDLEGVRPVVNFEPEDKRPDDKGWHLGRVKFFVNQLQRGLKLRPITIDCNCYGMHVSVEPIVIDGHHRLAAATFVKARRIPVSFSGRVDLRDYLTGKRRTLPDY
jgi:hypothetical protein